MQGKRARHRPAIRLGGTLPRPSKEKMEDKPAGELLDVVLKCDSYGSGEAVAGVLSKLGTPQAQIRVIHTGVGEISKTDLLLALSGSRLVLGFNVGVGPRLEQWAKEHDVEVRTYRLIYRLVEDIKGILQSLGRSRPEEKVTGKGKVIALFKTRPGGVILGCEVTEGVLAQGSEFRIISAMGPVYRGRIQSLRIETRPVKEATRGQQVGLKIPDFDRARIGDGVECYQSLSTERPARWSPRGGVFPVDS
ncbi:MAG TPA: hypothetical protein PLM79_15580 [Syntrophobacteraceae bacterium]|nr:hypothetical protein [Syntrophobacteraceae bacterium]